MARKNKEDTEHTYALLLDAAESVFTQKGVAATTLNDIAVAAGMTRGAITGTSRTRANSCARCVSVRRYRWRRWSTR